MRAPETGYIYDLQAHTIGGVVSPGQVIMSIVPQDSELKVDVKVSPVDIDRVTLGQGARMRFTTFNRRTTPEIAGTVDLISAATLTDRATNASYYKRASSLRLATSVHFPKSWPGYACRSLYRN